MSLPYDYQAHEAAAWFPMMSDESLDALVIDVKEHGLSTPIILTDDGLVLDGRNRLVACDRAGVDPSFQTYKGDDPVGFVITSNIVRRDLTKGQRAIIAAKALPRFEEEARQRRTSGRKLPKGQAGRATDRAAQIFGVNSDYIRQAKLVLKKDPERAQAILANDDLRAGSLQMAYYQLRPRTALVPTKEATARKERHEQYRETMLEAEAAMAAPPDLLEQMEMGVLSAKEVIDQAFGRKSMARWLALSIQGLTLEGGDDPGDVAFALFTSDNPGCDSLTVREASEFLMAVAEEWDRLK